MSFPLGSALPVTCDAGETQDVPEKMGPLGATYCVLVKEPTQETLVEVVGRLHTPPVVLEKFCVAHTARLVMEDMIDGVTPIWPS